MTGEAPGWSPSALAARVARDVVRSRHRYVNLGIGLPELVAARPECLDTVMFHTENGMLGMGPPPALGEEDFDLINAGKKCVTVVPGGSYFHHADSFAMIRGGHIDLCIMGAMQVSASGDLANWATGDEAEIPGVGGAMDLAVGAREVWVMMRHTTKEGSPKIVDECTYPVTAHKVVKRVYSDLAVIEFGAGGPYVSDLAPHVDFHVVQGRTSVRLGMRIGKCA